MNLIVLSLVLFDWLWAQALSADLPSYNIQLYNFSNSHCISTTDTMDLDDANIPRRGGNDFMGPFVGGAPLDDTYSLVTTEEPFMGELLLIQILATDIYKVIT